jgi:prepilin-type N-terminal cleavage/methylation domain-containing protein
MFRPKKSEEGFTLVEVIISVLVLSLISLLAYYSLVLASKTVMQANTRTTARSLAEGCMETILAAPYTFTLSGGVADYAFAAMPDGYTLFTTDRAGDPVSDKVYGIPWNYMAGTPYTGISPIDPGIQQITIIIQSTVTGRDLIKLTDFKVNK